MEVKKLKQVKVKLWEDDNIKRLFFMMVAVFIVMSLLNPKLFLSAGNFKSMGFQFAELGIFSLAVMLAMLAGGIDLSVVGIGNLSGIVAGLLMIRLANQGTNVVATILIGVAVALVIGILCGLFNGFLITKLGIPAMLTTLGTMEIYTGIGIILTKGSAVHGIPKEFCYMGNAYFLGIPVPLYLFTISVILFSILLQKRKFGFELYLLGTNAEAARFSGIKNKWTVIKAHMYGGLLAAIAGLILTARINSAKADYGTSYTLQAILIAVLGGVSPSGGFGKVKGVVMALLTLQFLSSGFNMLRFSNFLKDFLFGAVLISVMILNYYGNNKKAKKLNNKENLQIESVLEEK